ncbi:Imm3 family immunity protein [Paenibacillus sp. CH40]|uniref:Imm3 family immunity protein n=1 Tax=Paenibacillus sp. CH40 TaxID=2962045 RepID=UPI0020B8A30B|nr:Imm3 family immunity protein [Paenibacillus sp. CH40]MCP3792962.1 Imm3 family immunity protein [Paenibacillus sp. CH40]
MVYGYEEYLEYINENYQDYKNEEMMSSKEAIARTFYDFEGLMNRSETDKALINVVYGEILLTLPRVLYTVKNNLSKRLSELDFNLIEQEQKLTSEQYRDLFNRKNFVLQQLENKILDYYPRVCWYYDELTNEVNVFFKQVNEENVLADEVISSVFQRFERDCKNTLSEKLIVYTTLAENLLDQGLSKIDGLQLIKQELQQFNIADIFEEQLLEKEKLELDKRIKNVLSQVSS